jgi:hypothetical protein
MMIPWEHLRPLWRGIYILTLLILGLNLFMLAWGFVPGRLPLMLFMAVLFLLAVGTADRLDLRGGEPGYLLFLPWPVFMLAAIARVVLSPLWFVILLAARLLMRLGDEAWQAVCYGAHRYRERR